MFEQLLWIYRLYLLPLLLFRAANQYQQQRMKEPAYLAKKKIVKTLWIVSGFIMLSFPQLPMIITLSLLTTFLSFTILDETA